MKLHHALAYFVREAGVSTLRSWRVSLLAVVTIAVSLFLGGTFLLVGQNLARLVERWSAESRVVIYLDGAVDGERLAALRRRLETESWVVATHSKTAAEAAADFRDLFPGLADLVEEGDEQPLPPSVEVVVDPAASGTPAFESWVVGLAAEPGVTAVDDDRDWVRQLALWIAVARGGGIAIGGLLLAAAVFTIASVIRLTVYLYRDEIAVMRLVGATEFYIRGPFYAEGMIQGLLGGVAALAALRATFELVSLRAAGTLVGAVLAPAFLGWREMAWLVAAGGAAGLLGAILSLRRESLDSDE